MFLKEYNNCRVIILNAQEKALILVFKREVSNF